MWEDEAEWSGYVREVIDDATVYHRVNTRFDEDRWIDRVVVGEQAVREAVRQHIRDPLAGGSGTFRRGCSPRRRHRADRRQRHGLFAKVSDLADRVEELEEEPAEEKRKRKVAETELGVANSVDEENLTERLISGRAWS